MPDELTSHELSSFASFDNGVDDIPIERIFRPASQKLDSIAPLEASNGCKTWFRQIDSSTEIHGLLAPKIVGACEDAPPLGISAQIESQKSVYLSVMDGMGGAGAGQVHVSLPSAKFSTTEALIASRSVRDTVLKQVVDKQLFSPDRPVKNITKDLKKYITDDLELIDAACKISSSSKIRGTLTKRLPTTLLLAKIEPNQKDQRLQKTNFWWAGDSRAFLIQPKHGLASLSIDHVGPSDALEQLRSDPPIQNTISSSVPFSINYGSININGPYILLLASDGVFGYLPTPGMLELGILEAIQLPAKDFASNLMNFCGTYAADDVSAAIMTYNIFNNNEVLAVFSKRLEVLRERYKSLQAMDSSTEEYSTEVERLWNLERPQYERLIRGAK
jgi:serine/threonine protein phosphatase PrpC